MGITLYEHNLIAYKAALNQMEHTKKAAVIHPTGTGKFQKEGAAASRNFTLLKQQLPSFLSLSTFNHSFCSANISYSTRNSKAASSSS